MLVQKIPTLRSDGFHCPKCQVLLSPGAIVHCPNCQEVLMLELPETHDEHGRMLSHRLHWKQLTWSSEEGVKA